MQYSNFSQQFNSQLRMKTRLMTASRHFLYEQTLNLECCTGPSCESSVSSTNLIGFKSGDCLGHSNTLFYPCGTNSESCLKFVLVCCPILEGPSTVCLILIILVGGNRFILRISGCMAPFIFPSVIWILWSEKAQYQDVCFYLSVYTSWVNNNVWSKCHANCCIGNVFN